MQLSSEIGQAMMTLLSTLPIDAEVRFFWCDGIPHMKLKYADGTEELARLNRMPGGFGAIIPVNNVH